MSKKTTRVQLEMPPNSFERLKNLKEITEASSYSEVIRSALALYEDLIQRISVGDKILLKDIDGNVSPYNILLP